MQNAYSLIITKVPGGANPVISHGTETVRELFAAAFNGESINGYPNNCWWCIKRC